MKLAFELPPAEAQKLRHEVNRLGLAPEDLARAGVLDPLEYSRRANRLCA